MQEPAWFAGPEHHPFQLEADLPRAGALLLHGFAGTPAELQPLGASLAAAGLSARAPLLPGFGPGIHHLGDVRADDWLASAAAAWAAVSARHRHTVLVGYSMGGALALRLAAMQPPDRLVLVAPLWRLLGAAWPLGALLPFVQHVVPTIGLPDRDSAFANAEMRQFFTRAAPDLDLGQPEVRDEIRRRARLSTAVIGHLWRLSNSAADAARGVQVPTLVLQGLEDRVVRANDTRVLAGRLGGPVQLHELPAGHLLLDPTTATWERARQLILDFVEPVNKLSTNG